MVNNIWCLFRFYLSKQIISFPKAGIRLDVLWSVGFEICVEQWLSGRLNIGPKGPKGRRVGGREENTRREGRLIACSHMTLCHQ